MSFLYFNSINCYLYSRVQIYITAFVWGTARMLHDPEWRRALRRSLPILPIRNLSVLVTSLMPISSNSYLSHKLCFKQTRTDESFPFKIPTLHRNSIDSFLLPTPPTIRTKIMFINTITSLPRLRRTRCARNSQYRRYRLISTGTWVELRNGLFSK
jgi:hypothetical protein